MMNPELRRNLWLEFTTHRLLAMPVVLVLGLLMVAALDKDNAMANVSLAAMVAFALLTALWGSRLAANSIFDEMADKTWDWQRLSTLGPWEMTWGKLFGSTAFAWYGGAICLAIFVATSAASKIEAPFRFALFMLLVALILHGAAVSSALHLSRNGEAVRRRSVGLLTVVLLLYVIPLGISRAWKGGEQITWYGSPVDATHFLLASAAVFAAWALAGAYRAMCQSLAVRTTPWVWLLFMMFLAAYFGGFSPAAPEMNSARAGSMATGAGNWPGQIAYAGFLAGTISFYVMLFSEPAGTVVLRQIARKAAQAQWHRALQQMPCWPVSLAFALLCALALTLQNTLTDGAAYASRLAFLPVPVVLLAARDAAIYLFFSAAPKARRAAAATLLYIVLLDWVVPGLLMAFGLAGPASLVCPLHGTSPWLMCAIALAHAALAGWLAWRRIQMNFAAMRRPDAA